MLRGVNRQIIEINQPESEFFEKALLFVKPQYIDVPLHRLRAEADRFTQQLGHTGVAPGRLRRAAKRKRLRWVGLGAALLTVAVLLYLFI